MNTVRSFWLGWGSVCVAGAGAYYFAKREINADRQAKLEAMRRNKQDNRSMEYSVATPGQGDSGAANASPSGTNGSQPPIERSKFESKAAYRSPKGERL